MHLIKQEKISNKTNSVLEKVNQFLNQKKITDNKKRITAKNFKWNSIDDIINDEDDDEENYEEDEYEEEIDEMAKKFIKKKPVEEKNKKYDFNEKLQNIIAKKKNNENKNRYNNSNIQETKKIKNNLNKRVDNNNNKNYKEYEFTQNKKLSIHSEEKQKKDDYEEVVTDDGGDEDDEDVNGNSEDHDDDDDDQVIVKSLSQLSLEDEEEKITDLNSYNLKYNDEKNFHHKSDDVNLNETSHNNEMDKNLIQNISGEENDNKEINKEKIFNIKLMDSLEDYQFKNLKQQKQQQQNLLTLESEKLEKLKLEEEKIEEEIKNQKNKLKNMFGKDEVTEKNKLILEENEKLLHQNKTLHTEINNDEQKISFEPSKYQLKENQSPRTQTSSNKSKLKDLSETNFSHQQKSESNSLLSQLFNSSSSIIETTTSSNFILNNVVAPTQQTSNISANNKLSAENLKPISKIEFHTTLTKTKITSNDKENEKTNNFDQNEKINNFSQTDINHTHMLTLEKLFHKQQQQQQQEDSCFYTDPFNNNEFNFYNQTQNSFQQHPHVSNSSFVRFQNENYYNLNSQNNKFTNEQKSSATNPHFPPSHFPFHSSLPQQNFSHPHFYSPPSTHSNIFSKSFSPQFCSNFHSSFIPVKFDLNPELLVSENDLPNVYLINNIFKQQLELLVSCLDKNKQVYDHVNKILANHNQSSQQLHDYVTYEEVDKIIKTRKKSKKLKPTGKTKPK